MFFRATTDYSSTNRGDQRHIYRNILATEVTELNHHYKQSFVCVIFLYLTDILPQMWDTVTVVVRLCH